MCLSPFHIDNPSFPYKSKDRKVPVPCGKCPACLKRRANGWAFRLKQHEKICQTAKFITLTYDTEHVPFTEKGFMTLDKTDFQKFMKRLRKHHTMNNLSDKISYYAVGEYGSNTMRPHYHAIVFNMEPELLLKSWTKGQIHIGDVTGASIAYTCKYINKGKVIPVHINDDRVPEFSLMSKKLGANYLTPQMLKYHQDDISRNFVLLEEGIKVAMPRYYREKIYTPEQREQQGMLIKSSVLDTERKALESYVSKGNDIDRYDYDKFQSIKYLFENFKRLATQNRNKI